GDLDNDGFGELVVLMDDQTYHCFEHDGTPKWVSDTLQYSYAPPNIADFDEDGKPEVHGSNFILNGQTGATIVTQSLPPTGLGAPLGGTQAAFGMTTAVDVLPDSACADCGGLELVAGHSVYAVNLAMGTISAEVSAANGADGLVSIADVDRDGDLDAIVSTDALYAFPDVGFYIWDLQTPSIIATTAPYSSIWAKTIGRTTIGNLDGDALPEFVFTVHDTIYALDDVANGLATMWLHPISDESGFTEAVLFDFQVDGVNEVVYQCEDSLYIFRGADGVKLSTRHCTGGTIMNHPLVLDADGDDEAEIVCACSDALESDLNGRLHGYVVALGSGNNDRWPGTRQVWNQHSFFNVHVGDDLSIPTVQQNHHIVGDSVVLNGFNLQYPFANGPDTIPPQVICQSDTTIPLDSITCSAIVNYPGHASTDNCAVDSIALISGLGSGATFPNGPTLESYAVWDHVGNSDTCSFVVTVLDTSAPHISTCPPNSVHYLLPNQCQTAVNWTAPTFTDNCQIDSVANSHTSGAFFPPGVHTIQSTAFDPSGNFSTCIFTLTVLDTIAPTALCQSLTITLDSLGNGMIHPSMVDMGSNDNCGIQSLVLNQTNFGCADLGLQTVGLVVTDSSGNVDSCVANITVVDTVSLQADFNWTYVDSFSVQAIVLQNMSVSNFPTQSTWSSSQGDFSSLKNPRFNLQNPQAPLSICLTDSAGCASDTHCDTLDLPNLPWLDCEVKCMQICCTTQTNALSPPLLSTITNWSSIETPGIKIPFHVDSLAAGDSISCAIVPDSMLTDTGFLRTSSALLTVESCHNFQLANGNVTRYRDGYPYYQLETDFIYQTTGTLTADGCEIQFMNASSVLYGPDSLNFNANCLTYLWDFGDGDSTTSSDPAHTYQTLGSYQVCLTIRDTCRGSQCPGCESTYCKTIVVDCPVQTDPAQSSHISIFPNPASTRLFVEWKALTETKMHLQLLDIHGKMVIEKRAHIQQKGRFQLDVSMLPSAIYFLKLRYDDAVEVRKVEIIR
ncbi:MAG: HYR domain-containing protein, partial [Bacteroidota bacterium]